LLAALAKEAVYAAEFEAREAREGRLREIAAAG
jgi:hypothetical protein